MLHESIAYADNRLTNIKGIAKSHADGGSARYSLPLQIGGEQADLTYILTPYGEEREGGDSQLVIESYLDLRFEQEPNNMALNKDTDVAYNYFEAAINGALYLLRHRLCGIPYRKQIVLELPTLRQRKLRTTQVEHITSIQRPKS